MSDVVIRASGLGKRYVIGHQRERERYVALRDVIAGSMKRLARSAANAARGRGLGAAGDQETFWALKDVDFEIRRGDVVGIVGRNGAGKSTLLKVLSRITDPSEGRVEIRGRVASLLEVGTGFHPELTGRENIYLNGAVLGMARAEIRRKFDEIVAFAEVERFLDTPVKRYSSGMYVRLAFAVAAHLEPEILVVDEVLAVGDAEFQKKCMGKMQDVAGHGRTVLFVSHNLAAVHSLCRRSLLLAGGRVVLDGTAGEVVAQYAHFGEESYELGFDVRSDRPTITRIHVDKHALISRNLRVEISFCSPTPLQTPIGGVVLRAASGEAVWGSNGRFHSRVRETKGLCEGLLSCEANALPLQPGQYLVSIWLADWHADLDSKIDVMRVTIADAGDQRRPATSVIGYLDWPATWESRALLAHEQWR